MKTKKEAREFIKKEWNEKYVSQDTTDWEKLPLDDLENFLSHSYIGLKDIHTIMDIGCGRGLRLLVLLLREQELNREDVEVLGIDISAKAISDASEYLTKLHNGNACEHIRRYLSNDEGCSCTLKCDVKFLNADILEPLPDSCPKQFDLVIDWWCFHHVNKLDWDHYVSVISSICKRFFVLSVFSKEGNSQNFLPPVIPDVLKHPFSKEDIEGLFGKHFHILDQHGFPENLNPEPPHSDDFVAAKMAYLLLKRSPIK